jgi:uncharacterized protein YcfJ
MTKLRVLALVGMILMLAVPDAMAQRRGGAVRGGIRGAIVGGLLGGSEGAKVGRTIGAVTGGVRRAAYRADQRAVYQESQARAQYQSTVTYSSGRHSNFHQAAPRVIVSSRRVIRR